MIHKKAAGIQATGGSFYSKKILFAYSRELENVTRGKSGAFLF